MNKLQIYRVRNRLFNQFDKLLECETDVKNTKILTKFLNDNPDIVLCPVDKGKDLCFLKLEQYKHKLEEAFGDPNRFEKLEYDPIKQNIPNLQKLVRKLKPFVDNQT